MARKQDEILKLADQLSALITPGDAAPPIGRAIDLVVVLSALKNSIESRLKSLMTDLGQVLPDAQPNVALMCNGQHEHLEIREVQQSFVPPLALAKVLTLRKFCDCVRVQRDAAQHAIGEERLARLLKHVASTQIRKHRGLHPHPDYRVLKGELIKA